MTQPEWRTVAKSVVGCCLLLGVTGCSVFGSSTNGPLSSGGGFDGGITVGMFYPDHPGGMKSVGTVLLQNSSSDPVEITAVSLIDASGIAAADAYLLPSLPNVDFGGGFSIPPPTADYYDAEQAEMWEARISAIGSEITPGETKNLLVGIVPTGREGCGGTSEAIEVAYKQGSRSYVYVTLTGVEMLDADGVQCS